MIIVLFWILLSIVFYTYLGYTILLLIIKGVKSITGRKENIQEENFEPNVTIFITAYNEKEIIKDKVENLRLLDYPKEKMNFLWITDGSNDGSPELIRLFPGMEIHHENERKGKIGAMNRGMKYVNTPIIIFCDANNMLAPGSVKKVVEAFSDNTVGCVAGEKQIVKQHSDIAVSSGEGIYWQYESFIKELESEVNSTIGAAGELFAIRKELFEEVEPDTVLDDFVISLRIAQKGFKIKYVQEAIALEKSSASISDEMKRKIRIAAGCMQSIPRLKSLLNPFQYGFLSIQYWSHKILRWTVVPFALLCLLPLNLILAISSPNFIYDFLLFLQLFFYFMGFIGYLFRRHSTHLRVIFVPYYLIVMNLALIMGFVRYMNRSQTVNWEKAARRTN